VTDDKLLTSTQAAQHAGLAASTFRDYVADDRAPGPDLKIGGRGHWYESTIDEWLRTRPGQGARTDLADRHGKEDTK